MSTPAPAAAPAPKPSAPRRKRLLLLLTAVVAVVGLGYGAYWFIALRHFESTDNAYVSGNLVQITPQISGTVVAIYAEDTDFVRAGQPLVKLDPADAKVALDQAQSSLGQTVREVRTLFANTGAFEAQLRLREADVVKAQSDVERAQDDLARREGLVPSGAVSSEELNHVKTALANARSALAAAQAGVAAAREQLAANRALTEGTTVEQHPNVQRAAARVREAYLAFSRADLPAPVSGYVARRSVQVGGRVQAGAPLMTVVPLDQVWVDANFKESQLRGMRIGQPVTLTADVYGGTVTYHGKVDGLSAGTGAAFSLLPAQNATGNWIKVVQRVPVRIALDAEELKAHPLRVGLSMQARVDIADQSGKSLADTPPQRAVAQTAVFGSDSREADVIIDRIIASNVGSSPLASGKAGIDKGSAQAAAGSKPARNATPAAASAPQSAAATLAERG